MKRIVFIFLCISFSTLCAMEIPSKKNCCQTGDSLEVSPSSSPRTDGSKQLEQDVSALKKADNQEPYVVGCLYCCSLEQHY